MSEYKRVSNELKPPPPKERKRRRSSWIPSFNRRDAQTVLANTDPSDFWLSPDDFLADRFPLECKVAIGWIQTLLSVSAMVFGLYGCFGAHGMYRAKDPLIFRYVIGTLGADISHYALLGLVALFLYWTGGYPSVAHALPTFSMVSSAIQGLIFHVSAVVGIVILATDTDARTSAFLLTYVVIDVVQSLIATFMSAPLIISFCVTQFDAWRNRSRPIVEFRKSPDPNAFVRNTKQSQYEYALLEMHNPYTVPIRVLPPDA